MSKLLTIDDAAEQLGLSKRSLRRLISSGELPAYRVGAQSVRIKPADLEKALRPVIPNGKP
jgi:excisionase family DNA binding protein